MITSFLAHNGTIYKGKVLKEAINSVANDWENMAYAIRKEDDYASHITVKQKDNELKERLLQAKEIRKGNITNLTILQRIDTKLTGECIGILS